MNETESKQNATSFEKQDDRAACANCDWTGPIEDLNEIHDLFSRMETGDTMPAGECPECGCLANLVVDDSPKLIGRLTALGFTNADKGSWILTDRSGDPKIGVYTREHAEYIDDDFVYTVMLDDGRVHTAGANTADDALFYVADYLAKWTRELSEEVEYFNVKYRS